MRQKEYGGESDLGLTGAVLYDLPSPYTPHACGLLHLPQFIAKIRKHLAGELPVSYRRNFTRGFDGFLCLHLGVDPSDVIEAVNACESVSDLDAKLMDLFPADIRVHKWNRKLVQIGMSAMGREKLLEVKETMGLKKRGDLVSFADMIEVDEGRLD